MAKRFHFDSPAETYRADAAVVWCFDDRFTLVVEKFLKRIGIARSDSIRVAGGPKCLTSAGDEQTFVLRQLRLAQQLHATKRVILIAHSDCLAWGGLARFAGDTRAEREHHCRQLESAAAAVQSALPELTVDRLFVNFEGVWDAETTHSASAD